MIRKTLKYTILLFTLFMVSVLTVNAATKHQFSFQTYVCTDWSDDDLDCNVDYTQVANGGSVNPGDVVRLDLMYVPGDNPDISFQLGFTFNNTVLSPIYDGDELLYVAPQPPYYDGIYPAAGTSNTNKKRTNWVISTNQYQNGIYSLYEDTTQNTTLDTAGLLTSYYFKVNTAATPGTEMNFNYDATYTMFNNDSEFTVSNTKLEVFKVKDTDPSLKGITVKHSGTNYLTNFNSTTKTYNVYVPNSVSNVEIMGDPTKSTTVLTYSPTASGNVYGPLTVSSTRTVTISTVAEDGTHTDQYTVNVYRLSNVNTLSSLSLSGINFGTFASGTTTYTVANPVPYATSSTTITATPTSNKATLNPTSGTVKNLSVGSNAITVVVTPECAKSTYSSVPNNTGTACQTKTYTVNVTRTSPSTNNYLSSLTVDGTSVPSFVKTNNGPYSLTVGYDTTKVNIAGTAEDTQFAVVSGQIGEQNLGVGDNTFVITVTPQDPDTTARNYSVKIYRKSNNANLGSLTVTSSPQGTLNPSSFSAGTTSYTYTVGPDVTEVNIAATKGVSSQTSITGTGTYNPQTTSKVDIVVTAEDTTKTKTYTVNLVRNKSTDVTLDELSVAGYTLSPDYSDSVNSYTVTVPSTVNSVNVTADPHDSRTTATVSGKTTGLTTGNNTVTVTVVPEAGETAKRTITITVKKLAADANLTALTLDGISYGTFDSGTISYSKTVPYTTSSTKIAATLSDSKAIKTVKLNGTAISENTNVNLSVGANVFTVEVKAEDRNVTKTYTVTITRTAPSTNNYLSSLTVNSNSVPSFNKTNNGPYNVTVGYDTTKVTIAAVAEDTEFAVVTGNTGENNLQVGDNTFTVTVTPQDPDTAARTYTIKVHRQNNNANLGSLSVTSSPQGTLSPSSFSAGTTSYTYTVGPDVTEVTVAATKGVSSQTSITGTGTYNPQTTSKVDIVVTAEDTTKTKTYTVNLVRTKSTDVSLDALTVTGYTITPDYTDETNSYSVTVPSTETSVEVIATPHDSRTTATVTGKTTGLTTGNNTVTVTLVPEAGETAKRVITITVKKLSGDATLSGINLSNITLVPEFDSGETSYSIAVPYTTDKTALTSSLSTNKASKTDIFNSNSYTEGNEVSLSVGANTFKINVTAEDTNVTNTYTVVINRAAASDDAYLTDLTINGETVNGFNGSTTYSYNVTVGSTIESITIGATPNATSVLASESDIGVKNLSVGVNDFNIIVVAQNGETRVPYELHVTKLSGDNNLSTLSITSNPQGTQEPSAFNANITSYTYTVGPDVTEVVISGTVPTGANATGFGTYNPQNANERNVTISVSAQDPNVQAKEYNITIVRTESSINTLSGIKVNDVDIEGFDPGTPTYTVDVPYNTPTVTVTATPADGERESVTVTPPTTYGVGDNVYTISVEAEDGTPNTYTVTVHRKNNDNTLSGLGLSNGELNEQFDSATGEYTATVPYTTTTTTVNATATDTNLSPVIVGPDSLQVGENTFTVTVIPEDDNEPSKTYTITVTREAPSSNAYLTDLTIDTNTIEGFSGETIYEYTVNVSNATSSITIGATANAGSTVSSDSDIGEKSLSVGTNDFTIVALAQNGETRVPYTLHVKRLDNNSNLGSLTITSDPQGSLDNPFDPDTTEYTYTVGPDTGDVTIEATPEGNATVSISPDTASGTFDPNEVSQVTITVTPEEGEPKVYTINIDRQKSTDNTLISLGVQDYTMVPEFSNDHDTYAVTVPKEVDKATIIATKHDDRQTVSGLGEKQLAKGDNLFTVTVTPEDSNAEARNFYITITRQKSDIKTLSDLQVNGETIEGFSPDTPNYDLGTVSDDTSSINISATPTDPLSQVGGTGDIELQPGTNTIPITVTPEDGGEPQTYTITVYRALNTNNYLASLTVNGTSVPDFDKNTVAYEVSVPIDSETVNIDATPEVETSSVAGKGTAIPLNQDDVPTVVVISVIPQSGEDDKRDYSITITKSDETEYITSVAYGHIIEDGMIKDVAYKTTSETLKDQLDNDNSKLHVYKLDSDTTDISVSERLGTGYIIKLIKNNVLNDSKLLVIKGDVDGNGNVTLFDAVRVLNHYLEKETLTGPYWEAADVDNSGTVTLFDAVNVLKIYLNDND